MRAGPSLSDNFFDTPISHTQPTALPRQWRGSARMTPLLLKGLNGPARSRSTLAAGNILHKCETQPFSLPRVARTAQQLLLEKATSSPTPSQGVRHRTEWQCRGLTFVEFLRQTTCCCTSFTCVIRCHCHDNQAGWVFCTDEISEVWRVERYTTNKYQN